jgi:class 3 adenylate cyclase/tetratricopeptide (TPR) repeat protein
VNCAACGFENPDTARFCGRCGKPLGIECPSCGAMVASGLGYCTSCGGALAEPEERKVVTVLFADLVDFTRRAGRLDPEEVRGLLGPYYARLRSELERFGGTVEKFIGDAVVALFGAPAAHGDDPERGVRAGLAIREAIAELNASDPQLDLHVRIAVTTGEAVVALSARPSEGEGMAAGDVLNTAARLQAAAPEDGILVDAATYRATAEVVEYREAEPVVAKGKRMPIPVWEAVAPQRQPAPEALQRRRGQFVGRGGELDALRSALARAKDERSVQLVTLVGEPGIGKSRLLFELRRATAADPEHPVWQLGRCLPYGEGVTFWALGEMVKARAEILETDAAEDAEAKLRATVEAAIADPVEGSWIESHLRALVGLGGEVEIRGDRRSEAFAAWRRFHEALAARHPLVLAFEDLHWADDGLLDFIDHLVEWTNEAPLLVACTARPELLERRPGWSETRDNAFTIPLSVLTDEETGLLVGSLLEEIVLTEPAQEALLAQAGGNPLYAGEYVRMLADRGPGELGHGDLPLPDSVQAIIAARLDALPPVEKGLLQDAAVIGKAFWAGALVGLGGTPRWKVEELLLSLERKGFVRRVPRSSVARETQYAFWHLLLRDVAYGQIPRGRRGDKHRLAAEWIESLNPERAEDRADMLAHHYLSALELARASGRETALLAERAGLALREAGDRAAGLNAFPAAVRYYRGALDLWPEDDVERPQLLLHYGEARFHAEAAGADVLAEARDAFLALGDRESAAEAMVCLGELRWAEGDAEAFDHLERAAALLADSPPSPAKAHVLGSLARFRMIAAENDEAVRVGQEALEMADRLGSAELRAHVLASMGLARARVGDPRGLDDLRESIAAAVSINSLESVRAYSNLGNAVLDAGDLEQAFELHEQGRAAARRFGDADRILWFEGERMYEWYWRGRWDEAVELADRLVAQVEAGSPNIVEQDAKFVRSRIRLARGERTGAFEDSTRALGLGRRADYPEVVVPALALQARVLVETGRPGESEPLADELLSLWPQRCPTSYWVADLAFTLRALGRDQRLLAAVKAVRTESLWLEAAAAETFSNAANVYAAVGSLPDEAHARLRAAEELVQAGSRAEAAPQLAQATDFFRSVGAAGYLREAEALLALPG